MFRVIKAFVAYECSYLWAYRQRYILLSVFFQVSVSLAYSAFIHFYPWNLSVFTLLFLTLLLCFEGETWILAGFKGIHFQNLSLVPVACVWFIWVKIGVISMGLFLFMALNTVPWVMGDIMNIKPLMTFASFIPYFVGLHSFIFILTRGHLQELYAGPMLLIPFQVPLLLICFSTYPSFYFLNTLCAFASTFIFAWVISKTIPIQSTS